MAKSLLRRCGNWRVSGLFAALLLGALAEAGDESGGDDGSTPSDFGDNGGVGSLKATPPNIFGNDQGVPRLQFLALRSGDRPIDLSPPFSPGHFVYQAGLDFYLSSFAVDAGAATGMEILNVESLQTSKDILPGDQHEVLIIVRDIGSQAKMQYTVSVSRHNGQDVKMRALEVPGAILSPRFDPELMEYYVSIAAEQDHLNVHFVPWDTGQTFEVAAWNVKIEAPPAVARLLANDSWPVEAKPLSRRLDSNNGMPSNLAGEVQYSVLERRFPIEVGSTRLITILLRPANGDPVLTRTYSLKCLRAACPTFRPYYAPDLRACAITCNEGYFPAVAASRCEACSPHCLKCSAWGVCQICEPSRWRILYFVRPVGGYCQVVLVPWLPILLGLAGSVILCAMLCCVCGCGSCCGGVRRRKKIGATSGGRKESMGSEEDMQSSHRLLPRSGEQSYEDLYDE